MVTACRARTSIASISQMRKLRLKQAKYQAQVTGQDGGQAYLELMQPDIVRRKEQLPVVFSTNMGNC